MIQRSGFIALSLSPISRATARTFSAFALSSVSGMVKNCGAWGSIAPPMTVETMALLLAPISGRGVGKGGPYLAALVQHIFRRAHVGRRWWAWRSRLGALPEGVRAAIAHRVAPILPHCAPRRNGTE